MERVRPAEAVPGSGSGMAYGVSGSGIAHWRSGPGSEDILEGGESLSLATDHPSDCLTTLPSDSSCRRIWHRVFAVGTPGNGRPYREESLDWLSSEL